MIRIFLAAVGAALVLLLFVILFAATLAHLSAPRQMVVPAALAERIADAPPETLGRLALAVAAMHEPDRSGRCRQCRPDRRGWRWWRRTTEPCPTWRVMRVEVDAEPAPPSWTPA